MISRLSGKLLSAGGGLCEIEVAGVAYEVRVGERTLPTPGTNLTLHIHLHQRDEGPFLYGFLAKEEKTAFSALLAVHGVGPRLAQATVAALGTENLAKALRSRDVAALTRVPGLGRKRAETMIQEFGDGKAFEVSGLHSQVSSPRSVVPGSGFQEKAEAGGELAEGLRGLGYKEEEIAAVLARKLAGTTEEQLREAIRWLGGRV